MASLVEFFDILSVKGPVSWSPNTARIRLTLNYKRIPHKTTFLSFADIADNHKALNITPNTVGMPFTCPAILHHPSKSAIQDSFPIAKYLDDTFTGPEHPTIFPTGSHALITLTQNVLSTRVLPVILKLVVAKVPGILDVRVESTLYVLGRYGLVCQWRSTVKTRKRSEGVEGV
ncbi:hypothetical protein BCR33DRAFT_690898 [Rhizoclosmatium globosum]|uniref:GST N-terminal domain-containing protein n=1 Tax=Rhizoclosmatium globosum TaxID=329046 RepID=A0A1Y2AC49_9FUNG|nr:hypothetical protein BCR33DRAFT_690898 [Rhizoclosmatium globosum]|eukprot:ORY20143.1 hypothetical protein BCR33DRAFT_690898 [Rhizoclosmatium globosum]